jgi:hypothetical protein
VCVDLQAQLSRDNAIIDAVEFRAAALMQTAVRRRLGQRELARHMATVVIEYIDPESGEPYWHNPRTGWKTWTKPPLLMGETANKVVKLPKSIEEFCVACVNCEVKTATRLCDECADPYCNDCFIQLHRAGHKRHHQYTYIAPCAECHYQAATRVCNDCADCKQHVGSSLRGRKLCDSCFQNTHREGTSTGAHRWSPLVVMCAHCDALAGKWHCVFCDEDLCTQCFSHAHKRGRSARHAYKALVYHTTGMEKRARDEERDKEYAARAKIAAAKAAAELVVTKDSSIRRLQRVYRGYLGRVKGKAHMRNERLLVRNAYWANKADRKRRGTISYKLKSVIGMAEVLETDSPNTRAFKSAKLHKKALLAMEKMYTKVLGKEKGTMLEGTVGATKGSNIITTSVDMRAEINTLTGERQEPMRLERGDRIRIEEQKEGGTLGEAFLV